MKDEKTINWGISSDLQADIRYEPNACRGYVMDLTLGCPHQCTYCLFSSLELKMYKLHNHSYKGNTIHLNLDKFLKRTEFPPALYLSYSSDPLGDEESKESAKIVLKRLFEHNVNVLFITKGILDDSLIEIIKERPDLMNIQIDVASSDKIRNEILEPGAPTYEQRLENLRKLSKVEGLPPVVVRMDPLFPDVDDTEKNVRKVLQDVSEIGIKEAVMGYVILTKGLKAALTKNEYLKKSTEQMTEETPTISKTELYSIPFDEKVKRIQKMRLIVQEYGINVSVCGCKEEGFKKTDFEWICHPFNRKRREELNKIAPEQMRVSSDHLK